MRRRFFLGGLFGASALISKGSPLFSMEAPVKGQADSPVEKVKKTMLTMQRAAWEQGAASQALLELGESHQREILTIVLL